MRFLHTADLQLGLKLRFVPGESGARLRAQRFETLRRIADVAREHAVQAVVVAGDLFDDNAVGPDTLQMGRDALQTFAPTPVLLLPGNHDPATDHGALSRLEIGSHVRVLTSTEPVEIGEARFYPCPLQRRHTAADPTLQLPCRGPGEDWVRVAIAHGGVIDFGESTESPNLIDPRAVLDRGFDYLALGDWHGLFRYGDRVWYPGTPEPTHWREKEPGHVLVVDIASAGALPDVQPVAVARSRWVRREIVFERDEEVNELDRWLERLEEKSWTAVQLLLGGHLSLHARSELDRTLERNRERFLCLRVGVEELRTAPTPEDLAGLTLEGFVGDAVEQLRAGDSTAAQDALRLLYRWHREGATDGGEA